MNREFALLLWNSREYFSRGKRGFVYLSEHAGEKYLIKVKNPDSTASNTIYHEYHNNLELNKIGVGPVVFFYDADLDFVVRDFVDGLDFFSWVKFVEDKNKIKVFLLDLLDQCHRMDIMRINKLEMNHPHKDLLVLNDLPVIIDFERCKKTRKPKNVTQLCQFLISGNLNVALSKFNYIINTNLILSLAEKYKHAILDGNGEEFFLKIKKELARF
ncbi:MAG: hypothetical protein ACLFN8_02595 [Candidatus Woesearchaeota archaeon]